MSRQADKLPYITCSRQRLQAITRELKNLDAKCGLAGDFDEHEWVDAADVYRLVIQLEELIAQS